MRLDGYVDEHGYKYTGTQCANAQRLSLLRSMVGIPDRISWGEGLWTAATLIPAPVTGSLPPVERVRVERTSAGAV